MQDLEIVNPEQWIAAQVTATHPIRRPMLYVAHPVGPQRGDVLATCMRCQASQLFSRTAAVDLRFVCDHANVPVKQTSDPAAIVAFNVNRALRWWLWLRQLRAAVWSIPWAPSVQLGDDTDPECRAAGLQDAADHARRCEALMHCGPRVSSGMRGEAQVLVDIDRPVFQVLGQPSGEPPLEHPASVPWRRWHP